MTMCGARLEAMVHDEKEVMADGVAARVEDETIILSNANTTIGYARYEGRWFDRIYLRASGVPATGLWTAPH
jgi:hypothetical protein